MYEKFKEIDAKELQLPDTTFIRDIESKVFQSLTLQCLAKIKGISLLEGTFFDSLLGREVERVKGIQVEQDQKKHSVNIRVEINVHYGVSIPEKSEEIQTKIVEEISAFTGLHVGSVHVIFKNLIAPVEEKKEIKEPEIEDELQEEEFEESF
ncbi:MAG: hypothetical protein COT84_08890 [Chlamydiae bacterium CG10_big_fil_rev_8_21_14_0_10_35_9]|nr:MAG: hypothetical protein COT84_08890 [Chlamydiae bacterium CG10_big_fil_rev_8_21_14_0_10_35_9]